MFTETSSKVQRTIKNAIETRWFASVSYMYKSFLQESTETQRKKPVTKGTWKEIESERRDQQKSKKENQLYYKEHVARRNSIRLWFATSPTDPQGIYDTKSLSGGFSRMEHGRGRLGGAWLSFQGSSSRKASFLCREQPRVESRNSVPHHSASDVLTHAYTCTYTERARSGNSAKKREYTAWMCEW